MIQKKLKLQSLLKRKKVVKTRITLNVMPAVTPSNVWNCLHFSRQMDCIR